MSSEIKIELVDAKSWQRHLCHVCGGYTEEVYILAEGKDEDGDTIRVCETCLEIGDIDGRLERHARVLEESAVALRSLIGRLRVPSFAEWKEREKRVDVSFYALAAVQAYGGKSEFSCHAEQERVLSDDAAYKEWLALSEKFPGCPFILSEALRAEVRRIIEPDGGLAYDRTTPKFRVVS